MVKIECDHKVGTARYECAGETAEILVESLLACQAIVAAIRQQQPGIVPHFLTILQRELENPAAFAGSITIDLGAMRRRE